MQQDRPPPLSIKTGQQVQGDLLGASKRQAVVEVDHSPDHVSATRVPRVAASAPAQKQKSSARVK